MIIPLITLWMTTSLDCKCDDCPFQWQKMGNFSKLMSGFTKCLWSHHDHVHPLVTSDYIDFIFNLWNLCGKSRHTAKKRLVWFHTAFLFAYRSYTRFPHIPVCIPEFSILVIFVTFTYRFNTRTAIYQPHTRIYYIYQLYNNLWKPLFWLLSWSDIIFLEILQIF